MVVRGKATPHHTCFPDPCIFLWRPITNVTSAACPEKWHCPFRSSQGWCFNWDCAHWLQQPLFPIPSGNSAIYDNQEFPWSWPTPPSLEVDTHWLLYYVEFLHHCLSSWIKVPHEVFRSGKKRQYLFAIYLTNANPFTFYHIRESRTS